MEKRRKKSQDMLRRDRLSPFDLDISKVSQASSSPAGASQASNKEASQASSVEASLVVSLPDLGNSPPRRLQTDEPLTVVVHRSHDGEEMETQAIGLKRSRAQSPSPPSSPSQSNAVPTKNRYQALASTENMLDSPSNQGESSKGVIHRQKIASKDQKTPHKKISLKTKDFSKHSTVRPAKKASKNK